MTPEAGDGAPSSLRGTALRLREDVMLVPVASLEDDVRAALEAGEGDVAVSRPGGRQPSTLVDRRAAELLERFAEERTLLEAVVLHARSTGEDPEEVLEAAYGLVREMLSRGVLVAPGAAAETSGAEALLARGEVVAGRFEVLRPVSAMEDTDVLLARDGEGGGHAALKIAGRDGRPADLLRRELRVLRRLAGGVVPEVLWDGEAAGRPALALSWVRGTAFPRAADRLGRLDGGRAPLARVCAAVARAYARVHGRGVVHGDVHGRNVLVGRAGEVRLLDFGLARRRGADPPPPRDRGGIGFYRAPEAAAEVLAGRPLPPPDPLAEQYSVAALLYEGVTGHRHHDFDLRRREMHEQIRDAEPLPFEERDVEPWPGMEAVLLRALRRRPDERFEDMEAMAAELDAVAEAEAGRRAGVRGASRNGPGRPGSAAGRELRSMAEAVPPSLPETPPTASVEYGAAGIAYVLLRAARARGDARLLAAAERWVGRAREAAGREDAFYEPSIEITEDTVGRASLYHCPPGVHVVRALVGRALDDGAGFGAATDAFLRSTRREPEGPDLALGRSGLVLGSAILLDAAPGDADGLRGRLRRRGDELASGLWDELADRPPVGAEPGEHPGVAHGWAGYLYATLCWASVSGFDVPAPALDRLEGLASLAEPSGRGRIWPWWMPESGSPDHMPGWCNGSAGYVYLWTEAARVLDRPGLGELAVDAGWNAWEAPQKAGSLCCGLAGRAWALLRLHRHGAGRAWLRRARALAREARRDGKFPAERPWSLWKGRLALAALDVDLERPDEAACPLFEPEGWRRGAA